MTPAEPPNPRGIPWHRGLLMRSLRALAELGHAAPIRGLRAPETSRRCSGFTAFAPGFITSMVGTTDLIWALIMVHECFRKWLIMLMVHAPDFLCSAPCGQVNHRPRSINQFCSGASESSTQSGAQVAPFFPGTAASKLGAESPGWCTILL